MAAQAALFPSFKIGDFNKPLSLACMRKTKDTRIHKGISGIQGYIPFFPSIPFFKGLRISYQGLLFLFFCMQKKKSACKDTKQKKQ